MMMRITRGRALHRPRPARRAPFAHQGWLRQGRTSPADDVFNVTGEWPLRCGRRRPVGWRHHLTGPISREAMRWRGVNVLTNTPPRGAQRAPGGMQARPSWSRSLAEAARKLGVDEIEIHRSTHRSAGAVRCGERPRSAPAYDQRVRARSAGQGPRIFNWEEKKARSGSASAPRCAGRVWRSVPTRRVDRFRRQPAHRPSGRQGAVPVGYR